MPIYAYRCSACGHQKDVLQKLSDAPLSTCPACGAATFSKQVTAAGFQLKGSGWYVTDFRNGNGNGGKPAAAAPAADGAAPSGGADSGKAAADNAGGASSGSSSSNSSANNSANNSTSGAASAGSSAGAAAAPAASGGGKTPTAS